MEKIIDLIKKISGVYKITCRKNSKFYIGSSVNIDKRLKEHIRLLKQNKHPNKYLQNAWNKYGEENFKFEIIETINNKQQSLTREKWWLDNTQCYTREIGFNISLDPFSTNRGNFVDLTGQIFGKLSIIKRVENNKYGCSQWLCRCECGNTKVVSGHSLKSGNTKSCSCLKLKHGHTKNKKQSKTYHAWNDMIQRCTNPKCDAYNNCGERGITVCDRWLPENNGFINFLKDMGERPKGLILGRIDNNKLKDGYSLENCGWTTRKDQGKNMTNNIFVIFNNKKILLIELAEKYNINRGTLEHRLNKGMSIKDALTTPIRKYKRS